jgi:glyoxylase-like metal-dependent hydrolase (beta-lactamase superfamily II)
VEIVSGIHCITAGASPFPGVAPPNVYLAVGGQGAVFIDSGYRNDADIKTRLDYLETLGSPPVRGVLLTHRHRDHMGGAAHFHRATGAQLLSSLVEKPFVDASLEKSGEAVRVHRTVEEGETLALGGLTLEFVAAPGHTLGSMAIYARQRRALFTGDTVLGVGATAVKPEDGDMALYVQSLRHFLDYDISLICPGHGPMVGDPRAKINALIQHRQEREEQVLTALRQGQRTVDQIFQRIYPVLDTRLHPLARDQIRCHLIKLEREGRVRAVDAAYAPVE